MQSWRTDASVSVLMPCLGSWLAEVQRQSDCHAWLFSLQASRMQAHGQCLPAHAAFARRWRPRLLRFQRRSATCHGCEAQMRRQGQMSRMGIRGGCRRAGKQGGWRGSEQLAAENVQARRENMEAGMIARARSEAFLQMQGTC